MSGLPLSGFEVLSVEQSGAGPFGTRQLADLGAKVIAVENHRDGGYVGPGVSPAMVVPALGRNIDEVLRGAWLSSDGIAALRSCGAVA